jgi:long-chain acyl-CoA synthetase
MQQERSIASESLVLGRLLTRNARYRPHHLALVVDEIRLSWAELDAQVNRWANALMGLGVRRGDRVATLLRNCAELVWTYLACFKLGAAAVPLSPLLLADGLRSLLLDALPRVVVSSADFSHVLQQVSADVDPKPALALIDAARPGFECLTRLAASMDAAEPGFAVQSDDLATIMYTSGTTGLPKGIQHTHFIRAMYAALFSTNFRLAPESVALHTGAMVFNGAMLTFLPALYCGATFILHGQFDASAAVSAIDTHRVTHTMLVPSQIVALLDTPGFASERLHSLEMLASVGAPLHREHKDRLNRLLPGRFYEIYGLTEGFVTILDRDDALRKAGSVGVPMPFCDMRIVDAAGQDCALGEVGEIVGRGPITMPGYYRRDDLSAETLRNGWVHTGDLGYVDQDGYLYLVDRKKDMIDSGGVKIYPKDVEEVAARHPAVREAAVFGVPHEKWGETPLAALILQPGVTVSAKQLRDWINERVAARYQRVDRVEIMADFPRNVAGKTLKREMRARYWEGRDSKI